MIMIGSVGLRRVSKCANPRIWGVSHVCFWAAVHIPENKICKSDQWFCLNREDAGAVLKFPSECGDTGNKAVMH
jgi:hypothetical protein